MKNQLKAERYKLRHSNMPIIILLVCTAIIVVSILFGEMTFFGAGDGMTSIIGFQAKSYLSETTITFKAVARSALAYTSFFWVVAGLFTAIFFIKEYSTGTIKLSVAYGIKRQILYYAKAITIFLTSLLFYIGFIATFFIIEVVQSGYIPSIMELQNILGWTILCWLVLMAFESIIFFLCVLIQNTGIVIGISCLYIFSGASVYLMLWSNMNTTALSLKIFVYGNPMYYWMNFCSCRTMGIVDQLPFYLLSCFVLLIAGGWIISKKEIK